MKIYIYFFTSLLLFSGNITAQWYQQNSGTTANIHSIFFINENTGWACGDSGKIIKTTNSGLDWLEQNSNTTDRLKAIQFVDENNGWAYSLNQIFRTTDGGNTWDIESLSPYNIVGLQFVNSNTGWLVYQRIDLVAVISKTTDSGNTWTTQSELPDGDLEAMFFLDENYGWVTTFFLGSVIKTTDGGNSWSQHEGNLSGAPMCIRFVDEMTGWVSHNTLGSYGISKSTDGGVTWFLQTSESGKFINSISFPNSSIGYAAGFQMFLPPNPYEGFILKTTNGGTDWSEQYREDGELNSIFFVNDTMGWAAGNGGKILVTDNGGVTSADKNKLNPNGFSLSQNYPNPFNPKTIIEFRIADFGFVSLKVFDILGREIAALVNEEKPAGEYEIEFVGSNLPSGIYFYQLKSENYIETKKMLLMK